MSHSVRDECQQALLPDDSVSATLKMAACALAAANDQVATLEMSECRLAAALAGVLRWIPVPVVLIDGRGAVYACSDAALPLGVRPGGLVVALGPDVAGVVDQLLSVDQAAPVDVGPWRVARADAGPTVSAQVLVWQVADR